MPDATPPAPADPAPAVPGQRFSPDAAAALRNYVYLLIDPRTGRPVHVGRGRNDRCFRHLEAARTGAESSAKFPALERIRQIEAGGRHVKIDILRHGLTASEAKWVETVVTDALGLRSVPRSGATRRTAGSPAGSTTGLVDGVRLPVEAVHAALARAAKFKRGHRVVLVRSVATPPSAGGDPVSGDPVSGADAGDPDAGGADIPTPVPRGASTEPVLPGWRIGRRWLDPDDHRSPRWAVLVDGVLVQAVYRIERWVPVDAASNPGGSGAAGSADRSSGLAGPGAAPARFTFVGRRDPAMEERYLGRSVAAYLGRSPQSAVTYVWCGPHWVNQPG